MEAGPLTGSSSARSGRVNANGVDYYHEIHGEGSRCSCSMVGSSL